MDADIFKEFFGSSGPFGGAGDGFGGGGGGGMGAGSFRGGEGSTRHPHQRRKAAAIEHQLPCSLEDLYKGTTKKMKISRETTNASGKTLREEILTIEIKPGWKKGKKITFPEKGNEQPHVIPADLVFIIDEKPHSIFSREGDDLVVTQRISLVEALTRYTAHLTTLDGRNLTIPTNSIIHPGFKKVVPSEGMPIPTDPSRKGDLKLKFCIWFPSRLTAEQEAGVKRLLAP